MAPAHSCRFTEEELHEPIYSVQFRPKPSWLPVVTSVTCPHILDLSHRLSLDLIFYSGDICAFGPSVHPSIHVVRFGVFYFYKAKKDYFRGPFCCFLRLFSSFLQLCDSRVSETQHCAHVSCINPLTAADARLSVNLPRVRALELDWRARERERSRCARDSAPSFSDAGMDEAEAVNEDHSPPPVPPRANLQQNSPERRVKCVLVGDAAVGKTSLIISYTTNGYPAEHIPTAFDNFTARVVVDGRPVELQLCDMAGQDEFERLRPLCYRDADVFLLCYSVVLPSSFRSVTDRWAPEVHHLCPGVPIILVGTHCDLREDVQVLIRLADSQEKPVSGDDARLCARSIGAVTFAECSALTQKNLKEVFDGAILASMRHAEEAAWPTKHTLREKTPDKIKQLSETWWRKLSCIQSFDLQ